MARPPAPLPRRRRLPRSQHPPVLAPAIHLLLFLLLVFPPLATAAPAGGAQGGLRGGAHADATDADADAVPGDTGLMTLHRLSQAAVEKGAVCLDGSPPAYYRRPGFGTGKGKVLLFYEGGGWCHSDVDCVFRAHFPGGSSKKLWAHNEVSAAMGSYFLNESSNPLENWEILFMKYCDGSSFSSLLPDPVPRAGVFHNSTVYYRGQRVHEALMEEFVTRHGLLEATDVVVAGCSAGGLSVYLHIDEIAAMFERAGRKGKTKVRGLADSGFFLDGDGPGCHATADLHWLAERQLAPSPPDPAHFACLSTAAARRRARLRQKERADVSGEEEGALFTAEDRAQCLFAHNLIPALRTPVFSFVSRYDGAQLTAFSCLTPASENASSADPLPPPATPAAITAAGRRFRDAFIESFEATSVPHGYFLDACHRHCFWAMAPLGGANPWTDRATNPWTNVRGPSGRTAAQVFWDWYEGKGEEVGRWREEAAPGEVDFPCADCCGVPVAG